MKTAIVISGHNNMTPDGDEIAASLPFRPRRRADSDNVPEIWYAGETALIGELIPDNYPERSAGRAGAGGAARFRAMLAPDRVRMIGKGRRR